VYKTSFGDSAGQGRCVLTIGAQRRAVGDSLVVKQLENCATGLHISLGQATVARGVPAVTPLLLSEEPGSSCW
jgi:hypothetical protein